MSCPRSLARMRKRAHYESHGGHVCWGTEDGEGECGSHVAVVVKTVLGFHFGVRAPPILVYFSDVHWGYRILTHSHVEPLVLLGAFRRR